MGIRFRKSIKIAPGVKFNLNKKSVGLTFGTKGVHYTVNSKGQKTTSAGIPGTGLYYTQTTGGNSKDNKNPNSQKNSNTTPFDKKPTTNGPNEVKKWYENSAIIIAFLILFFPIGIYLMWKHSNWKNTTKLCISSLFLLFCVIALFNKSPTIKNIQVISTHVGDLDINKTVSIDYLISPSDSNETYEFHSSDKNIVSFRKSNDSEGTIVTHSKGTAEIWITSANGIESNRVDLKVVDMEAIEKAKAEELAKEEAARVESERLAKEKADKAEAEKLAKEEAARIESERLAKEEAARIESERLAKEEAARVESERLAKEEAARAEESNGIVENQISEGPVVWISETGSKYHSKNDCGRMNPNSARKVELSNAESSYSPCKKCY